MKDDFVQVEKTFMLVAGDQIINLQHKDQAESSAAICQVLAYITTLFLVHANLVFFQGRYIGKILNGNGISNISEDIKDY